MPYINTIDINGTTYNLENLTDGNYVVDLPELNKNDIFVLRGDVVDNLSSYQSNKPLSANQGRALDGKIDNFKSQLDTKDSELDNKISQLRTDMGANKYVHPTYTEHSSGLYKITVDVTGHVSSVTLATKDDITALGIPAQDTVYTLPQASATEIGGVKISSDIGINANDVAASASALNQAYTSLMDKYDYLLKRIEALESQSQETTV